MFRSAGVGVSGASVQVWTQQLGDFGPVLACETSRLRR